MMKNTLVPFLFVLFAVRTFASGYDIKTSSVIDQPDVKVLGWYNGSWYAVGFEKPGTLNKPPRYKLFKYSEGFKSGKISVLYPSFGDKTLYLNAEIIHNKISLFYASCEKLAEFVDLLDAREGHRQIAHIFRQDFDPNTLEADGEPKEIFNEGDDYFSSCGIEIAQSNDKTKTALLVKCYYRNQKYKLIVTDNQLGQIYSRIFDFKQTKEYFRFLQLKVTNEGNVFFVAKVRDDVVTLSQNNSKEQSTYYLYTVDKDELKPKFITLISPAGKDRTFTEPLAEALNNGELALAYDFFGTAKAATVKGTCVMRYDAALNQKATKDFLPDAKFAAQAETYLANKKENKFAHLQTERIVPLAGGGLILLQEYRNVVRTNPKDTMGIIERHYVIASRFDESLNLTAQNFIAKRQSSSTVAYAFSAQAFAKGNDVFLFYNDDWETDGEHSMNLLCTNLKADGSIVETKKVLRTSEDFYTNMQAIFSGTNGKVLFAEQRLVEYGDITREVKLLEITVK
jgi:hypothetical protein